MAQIQKIDRVCTPLVGTATRFVSSLQREWRAALQSMIGQHRSNTALT
jgi:hypothetical protein